MAYAAVISLKHAIERTINPTNPQITKSAYEKVKKSIEDILKILNSSSNRSNRNGINAFDAQIREAAYKLEDALESYGLHHSLPASDSLGDEDNCPKDEEIAKDEICSFLEMVKKLEEKYIRELEEEYIRELGNPLRQGGEREEDDDDDPIRPIQDLGGNKSTMVGLLDQFKKIRAEILEGYPGLKTVSLVGMAGIGKTCLAREIYQLPSIIEHFDVRVWVSLGPGCYTNKVLMYIAAQLKRQLGDRYWKNGSTDLGEHIYRYLFGRRYFIVLDDIWSKEPWDALRLYFPNCNNGSRLLLTTRLEEVAVSPSVHRIRLLNSEESWNLLCLNVFGEDHGVCPPQLEKYARKIVERCEGLPLLILKVAHLLNRAEKTKKYWSKAASRESMIFADAYNRISDVFLLSFGYLPHVLKACFLYMGAFPINYEIPLHKLISLWTVEDFLEPNETQTLQDFAIMCLENLVSQSLVFVRKDSSNNRIKSCKLHSTYWHFCVAEARKNKFLHVFNLSTLSFNEHMESEQRLSIQNSVLFGIKEAYDPMATTLRARSLLFTCEYHQYPIPICLDLMVFLKVLDALAVRFYEFPNEVLKLLQLKYLALTHNGNLPSLISKLQSLQNLIVSQHHNIKLVGETTCLPKEIWDMQELRHLRIMGSNRLPDPSSEAQLPNLLTLHVKGHSCTEDVFRSTPKLKKLGIKIELQPRSNEILNCFEHISILSELESLKCVVVNPRLRSQAVAPPNPHSGFPNSLKKMSLNGIGYSWDYMKAIGSLPKLQVLKLRCSAFRGPIWETKAEEFPALQLLLLEDIDLQQWEIVDDDEGCFPRLKRLIIRHCYNLEEIPWQIGEIPTLEAIEVVDCMPSAVASAKEIQEEQGDCGNIYFQVAISSSCKLG